MSNYGKYIRQAGTAQGIGAVIQGLQPLVGKVAQNLSMRKQIGQQLATAPADVRERMQNNVQGVSMPAQNAFFRAHPQYLDWIKGQGQTRGDLRQMSPEQRLSSIDEYANQNTDTSVIDRIGREARTNELRHMLQRAYAGDAKAMDDVMALNVGGDELDWNAMGISYSPTPREIAEKEAAQQQMMYDIRKKEPYWRAGARVYEAKEMKKLAEEPTDMEELQQTIPETPNAVNAYISSIGGISAKEREDIVEYYKTRIRKGDTPVEAWNAIGTSIREASSKRYKGGKMNPWGKPAIGNKRWEKYKGENWSM